MVPVIALATFPVPMLSGPGFVLLPGTVAQLGFLLALPCFITQPLLFCPAPQLFLLLALPLLITFPLRRAGVAPHVLATPACAFGVRYASCHGLLQTPCQPPVPCQCWQQER